jgi:hypothetical protein
MLAASVAGIGHAAGRAFEHVEFWHPLELVNSVVTHCLWGLDCIDDEIHPLVENS